MCRRFIILLPVSGVTPPFHQAWSKTYIVTTFWLKTQFYGDFEPYFYCACAETILILLLVSNLTMPFDPACSKSYMFKKSWLKMRFCGYFFSNVKFLPCSLHWRFSAHAGKTGSYCPILMPNELVHTILVPVLYHAKFGDDRLRTADARVVTDGHTHRHTDIHLLVLCPRHGIHCIV